MEIKKLVLGELDTNCYILIKDNNCLIIDPASDKDIIIDACKEYNVKGILVTHHHFDHVLALEDLEKHYNLKHNNHNIKEFPYEVINTPGHTNDSITFYFKEDNIMFTGDFLFFHTIGRCDFENSSVSDMKRSLELIKNYPDNIKIYPGHGIPSILGEEKKLFKNYF